MAKCHDNRRRRERRRKRTEKRRLLRIWVWNHTRDKFWAAYQPPSIDPAVLKSMEMNTVQWTEERMPVVFKQIVLVPRNEGPGP
jgi:hypothetical protein